VNCVIFPQKGNLPITAQISGSDLDGDLFFIAWETRLIPLETVEAFDYDATKPKP
jgi:RNA-dependent RNA polymerase